MRFRKRYFAIGGLAALAILCFLLMFSMFPPRGAEKGCDTSRGGNTHIYTDGRAGIFIGIHRALYPVSGEEADRRFV